MKIRLGFVSNSSSSSFVVKKKDLTDLQIYQIQNHIKVAKELNPTLLTDYEDEFPYCGDAWAIDETDEAINCWTSMDNFSMHQFLELIGVPRDVVTWDDDNRWR